MFGGLLRRLGWDRTGQLEPGVTTLEAVRRLLGAPDMEWREGPHRREIVWEYAFTPAGVKNYMLTFDANRLLQRVEQVLGEENFARVQPGMDREVVRRLLGRPASAVIHEGRGEEVWDWRLPSAPDARVHFNVHFDLAGRVRSTSRSEQSLA